MTRAWAIKKGERSKLFTVTALHVTLPEVFLETRGFIQCMGSIQRVSDYGK